MRPSSFLLCGSVLITLAIGVFSLGLACGCKPKQTLVKAKGKVLVAGQPYDPAADEELMIILYPMVEEGEVNNTYPGVTNPNGTFYVPGIGGEGVPPGKYRVSVEAMGGGGNKRLKVARSLVGRNSTFVCELDVGKEQIPDIDVVKP